VDWDLRSVIHGDMNFAHEAALRTRRWHQRALPGPEGEVAPSGGITPTPAMGGSLPTIGIGSAAMRRHAGTSKF
jgi:hypothetical protein